MSKPAPSAPADDALIIEHTEPAQLISGQIPRGFTAWHHFLSRALDVTKVPGFDIHSHVRLGTLPLEADVILLHLDPQADIRLFRQYFGFLTPVLRRYVVLEYKSPDDRLEFHDFDTVRAYAMLLKRKFGVEHDQDVSIALIYSRTDTRFFDTCAAAGWPFREIAPGLRHSNPTALNVFTVDLMTIGALTPDDPINLLSARRNLYRGGASPEQIGPFSVLYDELFLREIKQMAQHNIPGNQQLLDDAERTLQNFLARISPEMRLNGLPAEERLRGLPAEERLRGLPAEERLRGLPAEERLRGLPAEERLRGLAAKDRLHGLPAEEILRDLSAEERTRLRELLTKPDSH